MPTSPTNRKRESLQREGSVSNLSSNNNNRAGSPAPRRWKVRWKVLLVGVIVVWQIVMLMLSGGDLVKGSSSQISSKWISGRELALSAPVSLDTSGDTEEARTNRNSEEEDDLLKIERIQEEKRKQRGSQTDLPKQLADGSSDRATSDKGIENEQSVNVQETVIKETNSENIETGISKQTNKKATDHRPTYERCTPLAPAFGYLGATFALIFCCGGAGYGIAKSGVTLGQLAQHNRPMFLKGFLSVVMAELISIYGLISAVSLTLSVSSLKGRAYPLEAAYLHLSAGLCVGLSGLISGVTIGVIGSEFNLVMIRSNVAFTANILILIFSEALALYGLISAMLLKGTGDTLAWTKPTLPCHFITR